MKVHVDSLEVRLCDKLTTSCVLKSAGIRRTAAAPLSSAYCSMMWCVVKGEMMMWCVVKGEMMMGVW